MSSIHKQRKKPTFVINVVVVVVITAGAKTQTGPQSQAEDCRVRGQPSGR